MKKIIINDPYLSEKDAEEFMNKFIKASRTPRKLFFCPIELRREEIISFMEIMNNRHCI